MSRPLSPIASPAVPQSNRDPAEVVDPVDVIASDPDPMSRSRAHTALGRRAAARSDTDQAIWHYREALDLDPTDEVPKDELRGLGKTPHATPAPAPSRIGRLWKRAFHK